MLKRRSYPAKLVISGRKINQIIIDSHYEEKHLDINDKLILELVKLLDGEDFEARTRRGSWEYFVWDNIPHQGKLYRLVWCLEDGKNYLGVINCFRRK